MDANRPQDPQAPRGLAPPELDLGRILRGLFARRGRIALVGLLLAAGLAAVVLAKVNNEWTASVRLVVQDSAEVLGGTRLATSWSVPMDTSALDDLVKEDPIVHAVLRSVPDVSPRDVRSNVAFEGYRGGARMLVLHGTSTTPDRAAMLANAVAVAFVERQRVLLAERIEAERAEQARRVAAAREKVAAGQDAITEFVQRNGLQDDSQIGLLAQRSRTLDDRIAELTATMAAGQRVLELLTEKMEAEQELLHTATVMPSAAVQSPNTDRLRLAMMHQALAAGSDPGLAAKAVESKAAGKGVRTTSVAPNPVRQSLRMAVIEEESKLRAAQAELDAVTGWRTEVRRQLAEVPTLQREFQALTVQRDFAGEDLREGLAALAAIERVAANQRPLVEIATQATPPDKPERPLRQMLTAAAIVVGFVVSFMGAVVLEFRDTRVRAPSELRRVGLPVLATLPDIRQDSAGWEEGIRKVAFDLRQKAAHAGSYAVVITSARPGEGKTKVARSLTHVLAEWRIPVIRLDANLRDTASGPPLLESFLDGQSDRPLVQRLTDGVCTVTSGGPREDAVTLLQGERMDGLIRQAGRLFSLAVVDAPAVLPSVDAELLGQSVDGVILVVAAGQTEQEEVHAALERLLHAGSTVIGAVLTGVQRAWVGAEERVSPLPPPSKDAA
ncbi:MAG: hypothetical protein AMXMBFR64_26150 [Myxococcales bacterium]